MTLTTTTTPAPSSRGLHDALDRLANDPDSRARAVADALAATAGDRLDPGERGWIDALETLRSAMEASEEEISVALPNARGLEKFAPLADVCRQRSKKLRWAVLLLLLVRRLRPERVLELGTCLGVSAGYLAAGLHLNGRGGLVTLEGSGALACRAAQNLGVLGLDNAEVVPGLFRNTLDGVLDRHRPFQLAFIDGHHDEQATVEYFDRIFPALADPAVVIFDDIRWSAGMARAWKAIQEDARVQVAIDLDRVAACVVGSPPPTGARRSYRLPTVTVLAAAAKRRSRPAAAGSRIAALLTQRPARLHWGGGGERRSGWVNIASDPRSGAELTLDIRDGLPMPDATFDYAVSSYALQRVPLPHAVLVLGELRRVLKPGGALRLCLPDLEKAVEAWRCGAAAWFGVADRHAASLGGKFVTHVLWYGDAVSLYTPEWAEELLRQAGFSEVRHVRPGETTTGHDGITEADRRPEHSLAVEAIR